MNSYFGVVEDRHDPLNLGRVRVRVLSVHTDDLTLLPTEDLPWAPVMRQAGDVAIGTFTTLQEGAHVIVTFMDGDELQLPLVMGSIAGIPVDRATNTSGFNDPRTPEQLAEAPNTPEAVKHNDDGTGATVTNRSGNTFPLTLDEPNVSRYARNDGSSELDVNTAKAAYREFNLDIKTANGGPTFSQPDIPYNAKYPYNQVTPSESGHLNEIDDTPGSERIHSYHRSGTNHEIHPDGTQVDAIVKHYFQFVAGNSYTRVRGEKALTVAKGARLLLNADGAKGNDLAIEIGENGNFEIIVVKGDVSLKVNDGNLNKYVNGDVVEEIVGNLTRKVGGKLSETVDGAVSEKYGSQTTEGGTSVTIKSSMINLN